MTTLEKVPRYTNGKEASEYNTCVVHGDFGDWEDGGH